MSQHFYGVNEENHEMRFSRNRKSSSPDPKTDLPQHEFRVLPTRWISMFCGI